jgi:hypothetical protein
MKQPGDHGQPLARLHGAGAERSRRLLDQMELQLEDLG